jgi:hypothetical protein
VALKAVDGDHFENNAIEKVLREWCEANSIEIDEEPEPRPKKPQDALRGGRPLCGTNRFQGHICFIVILVDYSCW